MDDFKWLKESVDKIESKVDSLNIKMENIDLTTQGQAKDIEHHIYRTELAEENIALLREQIKPIENHVKMVGGVLKFVGILATLGSIASAIVAVLKFF